MPRVEAALLRAAAAHEAAGALQARPAELFDALGKSELAAGERKRAEADRAGAAADRERAHLRHEWLRTSPRPARPVA
jgi:hypothetical protein